TCQTEVDPNETGAGQPNFGIGTLEMATTGGNDLTIGASQNLHSYWDDRTVSGAMSLAKREDHLPDKSISTFAQDIVDKHEPTGWQMTGAPDTWPAAWATEALPLARSAITRITIDGSTNEDNGQCTWAVSLPSDYAAWADQQALIQLSK